MHICSAQTWGQFHLVNSTSNLSIPFFTYSYDLSLIGVDTPSTYLEYVLRVVYIPSPIVMEEIFLN